MLKLIYPDDAKFFCNLVLQRTNALTQVAGPSALISWFERGDTSAIESLHGNAELRTAILSIMEDDYTRDTDQVIALINHVTRPRSLVSIGPGNGILETMLLAKLDSIRTITLIDIEKSDSHSHGYASTGSGYASLEATRAFMRRNGVTCEINVCNPLREPLPQDNFDIVISILSMGFHYPSDEYSNHICNYCSPHGAVVLDKRKFVPDSGYDTILARNFQLFKSIDFGKFTRVSLTRG
jgi:hypothetical protein